MELAWFVHTAVYVSSPSALQLNNISLHGYEHFLVCHGILLSTFNDCKQYCLVYECAKWPEHDVSCFGHILRNGTAGSQGNSGLFLSRDCLSIFLKNFAFSGNSARKLQFLHIFANTGYFAVLF